MNKAKLLLEKWGFHALLLPIFFIIHNYQQYHGLVSNSVAIKLLFEILIFSLIFFLIVWSLTRHVNKSLQLTTLAGFIFLFFGVIKDFFEKTLHAYFLARYSVFLLLLLIATVFLTRLILKKKYFCKSNLFQY